MLSENFLFRLLPERITALSEKEDILLQAKQANTAEKIIAVKEGSWVGAAASGVVTVASYDVGHYGVAVFMIIKTVI
jgi:murein DD-endopeptidase MepM/ murein hydrolase activator NlpD